MNKRVTTLCALLIAGVLSTAATASIAQTTTDATPAPTTHAEKKAAKKQDEANKDAAVAQAKADKKMTQSQSKEISGFRNMPLQLLYLRSRRRTHYGEFVESHLRSSPQAQQLGCCQGTHKI